VRVFLTTARKNKNLTHESIAEKVGITRQYYGMIENGERTPSVYIARKIGEILEFDWTLFFEQSSNLGLLNGSISTS
jgi:putative transcriptional regulator